uniref:Uncharacterized protein n=1 Tax=Anguilla anguilla TaxID=7936 RepID=A0A0E9WSV6_ANGAN
MFLRYCFCSALYFIRTHCFPHCLDMSLRSLTENVVNLRVEHLYY